VWVNTASALSARSKYCVRPPVVWYNKKIREHNQSANLRSPVPEFFPGHTTSLCISYVCYAIQLGKFRYAVYTVRVTQLRILYHIHVCRFVNLIWRSLRRGVPSREAYRSRFLNHSHFWLYFLKKIWCTISINFKMPYLPLQPTPSLSYQYHPST